VHGQGKWISEKGDLYEGNFVNGKKEGHGVYAWKNGKKYEGRFKNGSR
jgi:radial spoke head protein 1